MNKEKRDRSQANLVPTYDVQSKRIYVNTFAVTAGRLDFHIVGIDLEPGVKANEDNETKVPIQVELVVPHAVIPSLIDVLQKTYGDWQKKSGNK